jgi:hypothetical protein
MSYSKALFILDYEYKYIDIIREFYEVLLFSEIQLFLRYVYVVQCKQEPYPTLRNRSCILNKMINFKEHLPLLHLN